MREYEVTMTFTQKDITNFLEALLASDLGGIQMRVVPIPRGGDVAPATPSRPPRFSHTPRRRQSRASKVSNTILAAFGDGPLDVPKVKTALEAAGLSANSVGAGLGKLVKSGELERLGDGLYQRRAVS